MFENNNISMNWSEDTYNNPREKIDIGLHNVRDMVKNGKNQIKKFPTCEILA